MESRISGTLESYLEQIASLQEDFGCAKTSDLAKRMGCKRSTVTNVLKRLSQKGLISYKAYYPVMLTLKGKETINTLNRYHGILAEFLSKVLAFSDKLAQEEACRLEHKLSQQTIERMYDYLQFVELKYGGNPPVDIAAFNEYLKNKK